MKKITVTICVFTISAVFFFYRAANGPAEMNSRNPGIQSKSEPVQEDPAKKLEPVKGIPKIPTEQELAQMREFFAQHRPRKPEAVQGETAIALEVAARQVRDAQRALEELKARFPAPAAGN